MPVRKQEPGNCTVADVTLDSDGTIQSPAPTVVSRSIRHLKHATVGQPNIIPAVMLMRSIGSNAV